MGTHIICSIAETLGQKCFINLAIDGDLSRWMHWLLTTHVPRYLRHYHSSGHIWQGRFKAFPIEGDEHLLAVLRYIERNPLRAGLVDRAQDWEWSSLPWLSKPELAPARLDAGTTPRGSGAQWLDGVNESSNTTAGEVDRLRECVRLDRPIGSPDWTAATAKQLGLQSSLKPRGRPSARARAAEAEVTAEASAERPLLAR